METTKLQKNFLKVLEDNAFNISAACIAMNINRRTYYRWLKNEAFADEVDNQREGSIDFAESKLMQAIKKGNLTAIIFYLKTIGKKRGYIETQEIQSNVPSPTLVELVKKYKEEEKQKKRDQKREITK